MEKKTESSSKKITVTIKKDGTVKEEHSFGSLYEFRLLFFDEGNTGTLGKLPMVAIETGLKEYATRWAADVSTVSIRQFESSLREQYPSVSLLSMLQVLDQNEARYLIENHYRKQCGPEDGRSPVKLRANYLTL